MSDQINIILFGAPGSGKGTQAPVLVEKFGLCHLATGDILRAAVANKTPAGLKAKDVMAAGGLVNDDIVMDIVRENVGLPGCKKGFILDGVPRTLNQAKQIDALLAERKAKLTKVISMEVPDKVIITRTSGRWIHQTGEPLMQRADDKADIVANRLTTFHRDTAPLLDHYEHQGLLSRINGNLAIGVVTKTVLALFGK